MRCRTRPISLAMLLTAAVVLAPSVTEAHEWDNDRDSARLALADAEWTISEDFPGTKLLFDGRYGFVRGSGQPVGGARLEHFAGVADLHLQLGLGQTGIEYMIAAVTPWVTREVYDRDPAKGKFQRQCDEVEWGRVLYSRDDPLGIDSYAEIVFARAGRRWERRGSPESRSFLTFGIKASLGWAWAESIAEEYGDVSNPVLGGWLNFAVGHEKWGRFYTYDRIVPGFTLGRPDQHATSREARIRAGYFNEVWRGLTVDVFFEKRSFNFADSVLPDLYTNSRRIGVEMGWEFGR